jgi:uncharacterized Zn-binding protein involved in type VI secretion
MPAPAAAQSLLNSVTGFPIPPVGPGEPVIGPFTVTVGPENLFAATVGTFVTPHGNPFNPYMPGLNPRCFFTTIAMTGSSPTVYVEGKPMARIGSMCACGQHYVSLGIPTVMVGP